MKILRHTYLLMLAALTAVMAACSSDDPSATGDNGQVVPPSETNGKLTLRIATHNDVTRATWEDNNATDDEMMNLWVVILTNEAGAVQKSWACRPAAGAEQEIDEIGEITKGAYVAYSFANISVENVCTLLGLTAGTVPTIGATPTELAVSGTITQTDAAAKTATINGNGFDPNAADNGYGEKGIPMSNVQTIAATDTEKDLIVVRMLAKMTVSVKNETGVGQYIKYATITGITDNVANNLKLLPNYTEASNANTMGAVHGDIQPNLNGTPATTELAIPGMATTEALANDATREVTFYVNECATGTDFYLTIGLGDASSTQEYRYALIDNKGETTDDDDMWDYIARNDYRIIPIILDDYHFQIVPYDFPPIGVFPVSVSEVDTENHIYNFTFHDYGHFHLLPLVTKGTSTQVKYNVGSGDYWTLQPATTSPNVSAWDNSFFTATTKGGVWLSSEQVEATGFYRTTGDIVKDDDNAGRAPVWYPNNSSSVPQWDPNLTPGVDPNYEPFIFGYIADPEEVMTADKKIYHEMKIRLYVGGNYRRDMTYRFYMTLSQDQMLYAPLHHAGIRHPAAHTTRR